MTLLDEIDKATDQGITLGTKHAKAEWREMALNCLKYICLTRETFTVNDFRDMVLNNPIKTHDNRAMGGVIKTGQSNGWIKPTGESIPSKVGHKVPIQIWQSLIYKPEGQKNLFDNF